MPLTTLQGLAATLPIAEANVTNLAADLAARPHLLGPYTLAYNNASIVADGVATLVALPICTVVGIWIVVDTAWNSSDPTTVSVGAGGTHAPPPDYDYTLVQSVDAKTASSSGTGYVASAAQTTGWQLLDFVTLTTTGYLMAETGGAYTGTPPTAGSARIWVLIST